MSKYYEVRINSGYLIGGEDYIKVQAESRQEAENLTLEIFADTIRATKIVEITLDAYHQMM